MGDLLRRFGKLVLHVFSWATCPAMLCMYLFNIIRVADGQPAMSAASSLRLMLLLHGLWFFARVCIEIQQHGGRLERIDNEIVGKNFGGFRKVDRVFCKALDAFAQGAIDDALDGFLSVLDYTDLTQPERGICSFYAGRCYQLTGYPSNAIQRYQDAVGCDVRNSYLLLFLARAQLECGDYDSSFDTYQQLVGVEPQDLICLRTDIGVLFLRQMDGKAAMPWFEASIARGENVAFALGGISIAHLLNGDTEKSAAYYERAVLNQIPDLEGFKLYYKEIQEGLAVQKEKAASKSN